MFQVSTSNSISVKSLLTTFNFNESRTFNTKIINIIFFVSVEPRVYDTQNLNSLVITITSIAPPFLSSDALR